MLITDDRDYFAAGSRMVPLAGARLAIMDGLAAYAAGAVVLVDDPAPIVADPIAWRDSVTATAAAHGVRHVRFYTSTNEGPMNSALAFAGVKHVQEIALVASGEAITDATAQRAASSCHVRRVATPSLWEQKLAIHLATPETSDGKPMDGNRWVAFEKAKVDAGYMDAYLVEWNGEPAGAFNISRCENLLRLKNVIVAPSRRHHHVATAMVRWLALHGLSLGVRFVGCFALPGSAGLRLYERCGMHQVGLQLEWIWPVGESLAKASGGRELPRAIR